MIGLKGSQLCWLFFLFLTMEIGLSWYGRTPIGKKRGMWAKTPPEELVASLLKEAASRCQVPHEIILASATSTGGNPARYAALMAGLPESVPAFQVDAQCLGSAQAIAIGWAKIKAGLAEAVWVGGMESASLSPTRGFHPADPRFDPQKPTFQTALFAPGDMHLPMPIQMQPLLADFSEQALTDWGVASKRKAWRAQEEHNLATIKFPNLPDELLKSPEADEYFLAQWKRRYSIQFMHPWNCAPEADAAALMVLTTQPTHILIRDVVTVGFSPHQAALACGMAVRQLLTQTGLGVQDIDLWEIHEAFSLKPTSICQNNAINPAKVNIFGGNIAYGHPFGASGAIGMMHLAEALRGQKKSMGIFTMSAAGGLGVAVLLECRN